MLYSADEVPMPMPVVTSWTNLGIFRLVERRFLLFFKRVVLEEQSVRFVEFVGELVMKETRYLPVKLGSTPEIRAFNRDRLTKFTGIAMYSSNEPLPYSTIEYLATPVIEE